jgi:lysophospholipase L1-like esterase
MHLRSLVLIVVSILMTAATPAAQAGEPSFRSFDKRAKAGERLSVVFFGASLTWGANASDPVYTSYRAQTGNWLEEHYPKAHFKFWDASIGGTNSQLGVFRFERDVLGRKPDLVFIDFCANDGAGSDDPETRASYESLIRRIILDAKAPVVAMLFPFQWDVQRGSTAGMKGLETQTAIAKAYNAPVGDAISLGIARVKNKEMTIKEIWPADGVHPGDAGYGMFTDAAKAAFLEGIERNLVCRAPEKMLYAPTYMANARVRISSLGPLPKGWIVGRPNLSAAWYDGLMSRWLDDVTIASAEEKPQPLKVKINGSMVLLYGEETTKSGGYMVVIDNNFLVVERPGGGPKVTTTFTASAKRFGGTRQHAQIVITGLDTSVDHIVEIIPVFEGDDEQELRIESICVAGGKATVEGVK